MSESIISEPMVGGGIALNAPTTKPEDQLLQSFNVFAITNPEELLLKLIHCRDAAFPVNTVTLSDQTQTFIRHYVEHTSTLETKKELSASVGISGSYGFFSASVQVDYSKSEYQSSRTFFSSNSASIRVGNLTYNGGNQTTLGLLRKELVDELKAIDTLKKADRFTQRWGTHLITKLSLGGTLFVEIRSESTSSEDKETLSINVEAAYKGAGSIEAVANVATEFNQKTTTSKITQHTTAYGGSANLAALVKPDKPATIKAWTDSCTKDTSYAAAENVEFYRLLEEEQVYRVAYTTLKRYLDLRLLAHSLEHPVIFAEHRSIRAYNTVVTTATNTLGKGFKIIGGGAAATFECSSYLCGSYPQYEPGKAPSGWHAISHDIELPATPATDRLSAYAIAVYDPGNYLDVAVHKIQGDNSKEGIGYADMGIPAGWLLTCGGIQTEMTGSSPAKYIMGNYPLQRDVWRALASDYLRGSSDTAIYCYAIAIRSRDPLLRLTTEHVHTPPATGQHGDVFASMDSCVCGGGVNVTEVEGKGNLVQMTYPDTPKKWRAYNSDMAGNVTTAKYQAFAIAIKAEVNLG